MKKATTSQPGELVGITTGPFVPETRTIVETKIYFLSVRDMRRPDYDYNPVAAFDSLDKLLAWMDSQKKNWTDKTESGTKYNKKFRKDTPLEWFEPPKNTEPSEHPMHGGFIGFQWVRMDTLTLKVPFNPEPICG